MEAAIQYLRERGPTTDRLLLDILDLQSPESFFSVRRFGAKGDGVTDDVVAIQAAIDSAGRSGGGIVFFPPGVYRLIRTRSGSGLVWHLSIQFDNVTLTGAHGQVLIRTDEAASTFFFAGMAKTVGLDHWINGYLSRLATYPILPSEAAQTFLICPNAAEFEPGDLVYIRTGQLVDGLIDQPDAEINEVAAVEGETIYLKWPLAKAYAQEYFVNGKSGKTTTVETPNPAIFGIVRATRHLIFNLIIEGLGFESTGNRSWSCGGQLIGHRFRRNRLKIAGNGWFSTIHRDTVFEGNASHITGAGPWKAHFASDTACSDVSIQDNLCTAERVGFIHIHEGSSRVQCRNNRILSRPSSDDENSISVRGRAYGVQITDNLVVNSGKVAAIYVGPEVTGAGRVAGNIVQGTTFRDAYSVSPESWVVA